jgi:MYXO-CTERM domain-containing protein
MSPETTLITVQCTLPGRVPRFLQTERGATTTTTRSSSSGCSCSVGRPTNPVPLAGLIVVLAAWARHRKHRRSRAMGPHRVVSKKSSPPVG